MRLTKQRAESMPMRETASRNARRTSPEGLRLGERLRQLRVAAGLTQSELAGERFSKEYVSQIERGKTRPTEGTIEWLADRLGVDAGFLANGVATDERTRLEGALSRAEALYEAQQDTEAAEAFEPLVAAARATGMPELQVRALCGSGLAKMRTGEHRAAVEILNEARSITEAESFSDVERADVLFWLGCCRYQLTSVQTALALFNEALGLAERSGLPCDALKANILSWRSRCWQRQRDFEAARDADAGRAVSSLAQVHLRTGNVEQAEDQARQALDLLDGRVDYIDEIGSAQLVLGRALLEQERFDEAEAASAAAETSFGELGSGSHRAAAWVARGDLAARRGDHERAAELYRTAAEALQDVRF